MQKRGEGWTEDRTNERLTPAASPSSEQRPTTGNPPPTGNTTPPQAQTRTHGKTPEDNSLSGGGLPCRASPPTLRLSPMPSTGHQGCAHVVCLALGGPQGETSSQTAPRELGPPESRVLPTPPPNPPPPGRTDQEREKGGGRGREEEGAEDEEASETKTAQAFPPRLFQITYPHPHYSGAL